ncbi:penicillin-binding protein 1C [Mesobacterium pallidum]|uniref:penicillin-binding protein 1C n=1 Tax=Mesobacterium pallidum TaxID=2872037 RepID=UPI001EE39BD2|nr:penicillin-binding protein 1C [Mesobacterium pallidum]
MKARWPVLLAIGLTAIGLARDRFDIWVGATDLPVLVIETGAEVRDRDGDLLRPYTVADGLWRLDAGVGDVDPLYLSMLIAYEDKRFRDHAGVDPVAVTRAVAQALRYRRLVSGGSTLTMQVARLLEDGTTGRWEGKVRQARVALALERELTKDEILGLYLKLAPFGGNVEGVRAASLAWFGKEPKRLTPAQAGLLVALPQAPTSRRPDRHHDAATAARSRVLARMESAGVIDAETRHAAETEPVPHARRDFPALAAHLADRVRTEAPLVTRHVLSIDGTAQRAFEDLAAQALLNRPDRLSIALMAVDHQTGEIRASVGSPGYADADLRQGYVDMTQAQRSPGSTLKPLVYAMAFDQGLAHPETLIDDRPVSFDGYAPQNFDGHFRGEIRVAEALRQSLNIPVVRLTSELGPERLMSALRRAGIRPELPGRTAGLAVALGGIGMTLEDLMRLYAALGRGGEAIEVHATPGMGAELGPLVSRSAAWQVGHILAALTPPSGAPQGPVAWKTGTSYGHRDAWAIGFDGRHVVGVWIGRADGTPVPGAFGGSLAAPVLFDAFQRLTPQRTPLPPPPPETLLLGNAQLPAPLQRFRGRDAVFEAADDAPKLAYPPDGAQVRTDGGALVVKLRDGTPPFTVLADGRPLRTGERRREIALTLPGRGWTQVTVLDATGRSDRVTVELR